MELTKRDMQQVAGMLAEAQAQVAALPPEQRAMVEQAMKAQLGAAAAQPPAVKTTIEKTAKSETINGWSCTAYEVLADGKLDQEAWVTDWKSFGLTAADFAALEQFGEFMKQLASPFAKNVDNAFFARYSDTERPDALPGVPVRTISLGPDGRWTSEIKKLARQDIPSSQFEVPAGLRKQAMMER
jgi:hypothetical protein